MIPYDKAFEVLLELGNSTERWTGNELFDRALRACLMLTEADAVIILTSSRGLEERIALHTGSSVLAVLQAPPVGSEVIRNLAQSCQPLAVPDLTEEPQIAAADGCPGVDPGPVLYVPLRLRQLAPAYLAAYRRRGRARFTRYDVRSMLLLGAWLSSAIETLRLSSGRERLAITDELTSVYNLRFLEAALARELRRGRRFGHEVSIAKIEVDRSYPVGDAEPDDSTAATILAELALVLSRQVRSFDLLGRGDGNTFLLLLPQTTREDAVDVAERARVAVESHSFSDRPAGAMTLSVGVATALEDGADAGKLLAAADRALERAREQGRNCVATLPRRAA